MAEQDAAIARATATDAKKTLPDEHRAYGIETCGEAVGDDVYVVDFLEQEADRITSRIHDTATNLTAESS